MASHNPGFITASTISRLLGNARKKGELSAGALTFCEELALERAGIAEIINSVFMGNKATEHGLSHEAEAIQVYESATFSTVTDQQKGVSSPEMWLSCTPDGYSGADKLVEIKCPFSEMKHFQYLRNPNALVADYFDQLQLQLYLTGRKSVDIVSYHPHFTEPHNLVIATVYPDSEWAYNMLHKVEKANAYIAEIIGSIQFQGDGSIRQG